MRIVIDVDAVLPVNYVSEGDDVRKKYRPFKVIEDCSHSDSDDDPNERRHTSWYKMSETTAQKRSRSPSCPSSIAVDPDIKPRKNWAKKMLRGDTPYSILKQRDLFERCTYIMDHKDYIWCRENNVPDKLFGTAVTLLERAYASYLINITRNRDAVHGGGCVASGGEKDIGPGDGVSHGQSDGIACGVCSQKEHSEQDCGRFLRCRRCDVQAHLSCWYLSEFPHDAEKWLCPACHVARREKGVGHCCICQRRGGVMLPYLSAVEWRRSEQYGTEESPKEDSSAALFCHVVCALAFPELTVDAQKRIVHPTKRARRVGMIALCVFCRSNGGEGLTTCRHSRCFASMHPACAQAAGTVECYRGENTALSSPWNGCRVYCSDHFKEALSVFADSEVTSENAEAEALRQVTPSGLVALSDPDDSLDSSMAGGTSISFIASCLDVVKKRWVEKRAQQLRESAQMVEEIRRGTRDMLSVLFRPEVVKVSATEVHLSRYVLLMPELQQRINAAVEGTLPIADDEYDDVQQYRKVQSRTRHAGNTAQLYEKMQQVVLHVGTFCKLADVIRKRAALRREWVETEVKILQLRCGVDDGRDR